MFEKLLLWLLGLLQRRIEKKIDKGRMTEEKAAAWDQHIEELQEKNRKLRESLHADR